MTSLRARLFVLILAITAGVWSLAAAWVYVHTRAEVQRVLDRRLVEAATMVSSLAQSGDLLSASRQSRLVPLPRYSRQLSCQIWSMSGQLVARSSGAPDQPLATGGAGMSERAINGETWRVFTVVDPAKNIRVSVGDSVSVRQRLIRDLMLGLLLPALAGLLALAFLVWTAVGRGLLPLRKISTALRRRDASDFSPLGISPTSEIAPLVMAIDDRSTQLAKVREAERHFLASAAHELQTPLAGLKVHAQVAARTDDPAILKRSLDDISQSVDRTSHLVAQLLELARAEGEAPVSVEDVNLAEVGEALSAEFSHALASRQLTLRLDPSLQSTSLSTAKAELTIALKNLVSNAINYSPEGATITLASERFDNRIAISIADEGPGISATEVRKVRGRFARGTGATMSGTGLGLSIVDTIAARLGGELELRSNPSGGLVAALLLPA